MRIPHILPCLVLLLAACTENLETNYITFRVSDEDYLPAPEVATRAVTEAPAVLPLESNLDEDLVLMTTIEDGINLPMQPATRGAQTGTGSTFAFGVSEYASNGTTAVTNFQNVQFSGTSAQPSTAQTVNSGKTWESDAAANAYRFYAYSPTLTTGTASNGLTLQSGNKTITYDCTSVSVANQQDLMTAHASSTYNSNGVALAFGHRLCAVKIQLAAGWNTNYTIKGVSFSSVVKSGTVSLADGSWSSLGTAGAYTPAGITETSSASGGVAVYLMMVPQTLSSCVMTVTLQKSGESYQSTLKATLNNNTWGAGQTVTYTISPSAITSVTVTYPASWSPTSGTTTITGPVTTYTTTDSFGLFAVDKDGKIVISNLQITAPTANAASQTITLPSGPLYSQQYTYYIYYPYQSTLTTTDPTLAAGQTTSATDADTFFANVISGWSSPASTNDQSALATFKSLDLQVAKASGANFAMGHKMGLVKISLGTKSVPTTRNYSASGSQAADATGMRYTDSAGTTSVTASGSFDATCKPYNPSSGNYWYIVRGSKTGTTYPKTFKSVSTVNTDWEYANVSVNEGKYLNITVSGNYIKRLCYKFTAVFSYTGTCQEFKLPVKGTTTFECWGAAGGEAAHGQASAGYVSGTTSDFPKWLQLYCHVGKKGDERNAYVGNNYNGGGDPGWSSATASGCGGGGASDFRLASGAWDNVASLNSRIIVAGGGGGNCAVGNNQPTGSCGGGVNGYGGLRVDSPNLTINCGNGGTATAGGAAPTQYSGSGSNGQAGSLGKGGSGGSNGNYASSGGCGGGGGYYGGSGGSGYPSNGINLQGGGGSSFISGHAGCIAVNYQSASDKSVLYYNTVNYKFTTTRMIDGGGYLWNATVTSSQPGSPTTDGSTTEIGHLGNGYAKITLTTPAND